MRFAIERVGWGELVVSLPSHRCGGHVVTFKYNREKEMLIITFMFCIRSSRGVLQWPILPCGCVAYKKVSSSDVEEKIVAPNDRMFVESFDSFDHD